jgi:hypothetical protein
MKENVAEPADWTKQWKDSLFVDFDRIHRGVFPRWTILEKSKSRAVRRYIAFITVMVCCSISCVGSYTTPATERIGKIVELNPENARIAAQVAETHWMVRASAEIIGMSAVSVVLTAALVATIRMAGRSQGHSFYRFSTILRNRRNSIRTTLKFSIFLWMLASFAAVLLDLMLPEENGWASIVRTGALPVLLVGVAFWIQGLFSAGPYVFLAEKATQEQKREIRNKKQRMRLLRELNATARAERGKHE